MRSESVSLRVPRGSVYGFLGRNGAGKSTMIKMLLGMVQPSYGRAELCGEEVSRLGPRREAASPTSPRATRSTAG